MTAKELRDSNPRLRGDITFTHEGKTYKSFVCYGCQSCWHLTEDDKLEESYPHFLAPLKEVTAEGAI